MKILLILSGLLILLVILKLFIESVNEGFEDIALKPETIQGYNKFLLFYNAFCTNWDKAITSSVASEIPQEPLTDPSQVSKTGTSPPISLEQKNQYITQLSQELNEELPPICQNLPTTINSSNLVQVTQQIPSDIQPFINALNWMNQNLEKSHGNLGSALQGQSATEGFQDNCQNVSQCLLNNPDLLKQLSENISEQNIEQQSQLMSKINPFLNTQSLTELFNENNTLMEKSQEIQNKAQSGELINQINVPGGNSIASYEKPSGANNMIDMKQNNPDRYNELKQNYSQLFNLKNMLDGINANL
jgi:hypothetical protein